MENIDKLEDQPANANQDLAESDFYLNKILISPGRGEIQSFNETVSVEPKVMDVLVRLALSGGEVISPEQLFAQVWPRSVYNPVSVRRCIALLRKVLGDNDKTLIKTHPKRGYSLIADIEWQTDQSQARARLRPAILLSLLVLVIAIVSGIVSVSDHLLPQPKPDTKIEKAWQVKNLRPVTASPGNESYARFITGSDALVFSRDKEVDGNFLASELWLKNLSSGQANQLFSSKEKILYFNQVKQPDTSNHLTLLVASKHAKGISFHQLGFNKDLQLIASELKFSLDSAVWVNPFFTDQAHVYFLANIAGSRSLFSGSLADGKIELLLAPSSDFSPYKIAKAEGKPRIALLGFDQNHISQIKQFSLLNHDITQVKSLDANWYFIDAHPNGEDYLLSDGKSLFQLNSTGELLAIGFENYDFLHYPSLSLDGKKMLYTQANIKGNISTINLLTDEYSRLTHSNMHDWQGVISPDGEKLAYVSNRNGHSQLFVLDLASQEHTLAYANPEQHLALSQPVWSPDSTQIASARNDHVFVLDLALNTPKVRYYDEVIGQPKQWYRQQNALLIANKAYPSTNWLKLDLTTSKQSLIKASSKQVLLDNADQVLLVDRDKITDKDDHPVWQIKTPGQIVRAFPQAKGIYLLLENSTNKDKPYSIWLYDQPSSTRTKIRDIDLRGLEVSDIKADLVTLSSFASKKDIAVMDIE